MASICAALGINFLSGHIEYCIQKWLPATRVSGEQMGAVNMKMSRRDPVGGLCEGGAWTLWGKALRSPCVSPPVVFSNFRRAIPAAMTRRENPVL
jgi:hypothetical protein